MRELFVCLCRHCAPLAEGQKIAYVRRKTNDGGTWQGAERQREGAEMQGEDSDFDLEPS